MLLKKNHNLRINFFHIGFEIGIIIKGIDGILEILGGFLFVFINPSRLNNIVVLLTRHELSEDPQDIIARFLIKTSSQFSISAQHFSIFYLLSHGVIKLLLVGLLIQKKYWSYPLTIIFLILFIIYQIYRYTFDHSLWLLLLTVFDLFMIFLTWKEYRRQ